MITFRPSSVRPSVLPCVRPLTFSNDFFEAEAELRVGERKIAKMVAVR